MRTFALSAVAACLLASPALAILYPTIATAVSMFTTAYRNVLSVAVDIDYCFPQAENVKEYLKVRMFFY